MTAAYLDSCIVIYTVEGTLEPPPDTTQLTLVTTDLVRLECLVKPLANDDSTLVSMFLEYFESLTAVELHRGVFEHAAELRARHRLKTPDAIHLAAALEGGCDEFWTNDSRLSGTNDRIAFRVLP